MIDTKQKLAGTVVIGKPSSTLELIEVDGGYVIRVSDPNGTQELIGIDNKPISDSENLITSGGVRKALNSVGVGESGVVEDTYGGYEYSGLHFDLNIPKLEIDKYGRVTYAQDIPGHTVDSNVVRQIPCFITKSQYQRARVQMGSYMIYRFYEEDVNGNARNELTSIDHFMPEDLEVDAETGFASIISSFVRIPDNNKHFGYVDYPVNEMRYIFQDKGNLYMHCEILNLSEILQYLTKLEDDAGIAAADRATELTVYYFYRSNGYPEISPM